MLLLLLLLLLAPPVYLLTYLLTWLGYNPSTPSLNG
jgi:hypothetical protein